MRTQRAVEFLRDRTVVLGTARYDISIDSGDEAILVRLADGEAYRLLSDWVPGEPVWNGMVNDELVAVQVRPILNGYAIAHRGVRSTLGSIRARRRGLRR